MNPHKVDRSRLKQLTDLPNVGKAVANDLRLLGFDSPGQLAGESPFELYERLCRKTGQRQDPCVLDVFMSITDFLKGGPPRPWWAFSEERKSAGRLTPELSTGAQRGASHLILYVADQGRSTVFYSTVLGIEPRLNVPGMTEFDLPGGAVLGLMPVSSIQKLLGPALPDPALANGIPRSELYLLLDHPETFHARALAMGAKELSPLLSRSWGHRAAYSLDPDGHVVSFASVERHEQAVVQGRQGLFHGSKSIPV